MCHCNGSGKRERFSVYRRGVDQERRPDLSAVCSKVWWWFSDSPMPEGCRSLSAVWSVGGRISLSKFWTGTDHWIQIYGSDPWRKTFTKWYYRSCGYYSRRCPGKRKWGWDYYLLCWRHAGRGYCLGKCYLQKRMWEKIGTELPLWEQPAMV